MKVLVCGGRDFSDRDGLFAALDAVHAQTPVSTLIEGGARGADQMTGEWASEPGIAHLRFEADWRANGRAAGPIRNGRMLDEGRPQLGVAVPGGRGTANMVKQARNAGVPVVESMGSVAQNL